MNFTLEAELVHLVVALREAVMTLTKSLQHLNDAVERGLDPQPVEKESPPCGDDCPRS